MFGTYVSPSGSSSGTTVGVAFLNLTNPSAVTFPRINADNTVTALSAAAFLTAIGAAGLGANAFTAAQTVTFGIAAATQSTGLALVNSTAATNGNQTWSPSLALRGNQWASGASRTCEVLQTVVPTQQDFDHVTLRFSTKHGGDAVADCLNLRFYNTFPFIEPTSGKTLTIGGSAGNSALNFQFNGTAYAAFDAAANFSLYDCNIATGTTTGTKFGTATAQKMSWWNATPVVQQVLATGGGATVDNVITLLQTLGLCRQA